MYSSGTANRGFLKKMRETARKPSEDAALVQAALEGCDQAFASLIDRYRQVVFGTVWSLLQDFDDAEDAAQEAFVLAYRHLNDLKSPEKFSSWIYSIATNVGRKWLGKRRLERQRFIRLEQAAEMAFRPEEEKESLHPGALREAFEVLSVEDRATATLFYLVGLDQGQVADILGIPLGTVKSRLHRSRNQLKRRVLEMAKETLQDRASGEDYGRAVIEGMRGVIHWKRLLQEKGLEGWTPGNPDRSEGEALEEVWKRSGGAIVGEDVDQSDGERLLIGEASWKDYEFSLLITPISGGNAQVQFRISEDKQCYYMLDLLLGWQAIAISKVDQRGLQKLSVVNFPIELGREYDVQIAVREASLTSYVDGQLINQVTDFSYRAGPIALTVWLSKTAFRDPRIRFLH